MNWYFRHEGSVSGPVPQLALERYLLMGRIDLDDEVSLDQVEWTKIRLVPEFSKTMAQLVEFEASQREIAERIEHEAQDAPPPAPAVEEASAIERDADIREKLKSGELIDLESARAQLFAPIEKKESSLPGYLLLAGIVAAALAAIYFFRPVNPIKIEVAPECGKKPAPDVNWQSCDKAGAWLKGAKLTHANLSQAKLNSAQLEGADLTDATLVNSDLGFANLKGADLSGADLSGADLRDADLTGAKLADATLAGAKLDRAMMPDGSHCAEGSIGACNR